MGKKPSTPVEHATKALGGIYGHTKMVKSLAEHIDKNIDEWRRSSDEDETLEHLVHLQIWNWYAGGDTALHAAQEVLKIYEP